MPSKSSKDTVGPDWYQDEATIARKAIQFVRWCGRWAGSRKHENSLVSITIYPPAPHREKWLIVCKRGMAGGYREVSFHQSHSILGALNGAFSRMADGTAKWKADEYDKKRDWQG